jgi:hypothetical protein
VLNDEDVVTCKCTDCPHVAEYSTLDRRIELKMNPTMMIDDMPKFFKAGIDGACVYQIGEYNWKKWFKKYKTVFTTTPKRYD